MLYNGLGEYGKARDAAQRSLARQPHDPAVATLVDKLAAASSEFRRIWDVARNGRRRYRHPLAGEIVLHSQRLDIPNEPDQTLFAYSVVPGSSSDAGLRRLARATERAIAGRTGEQRPWLPPGKPPRCSVHRTEPARR